MRGYEERLGGEWVDGQWVQFNPEPGFEGVASRLMGEQRVALEGKVNAEVLRMVMDYERQCFDDVITMEAAKGEGLATGESVMNTAWARWKDASICLSEAWKMVTRGSV
jgi:hypothetical protein